MDLVERFSRMALELESFETADEALGSISQYARAAVDAEDAGILMLHGLGVETPAATSERVARAHELQSEFGEGPCLQAVSGGEHTYLVGNTLHDERWPHWGKAAADLGYFSVVSSSLETSKRRFGSLNVYSTRPDAFDRADVAVMKMLAAHASVAIAASRTRTELHEALRSRTVIGQAQGILMHAFQIDSDRAFAYMRRLSQDQNVRLFKIAEMVLENREQLGILNAGPAADESPA